MADDILEQAAERRMRRSHKNGHKPGGLTIDHFCEQPNSDSSHLNTISPRGRSGRNGETTSDDFLVAGDDKVYSPPFILCQIHGTELKCLIDSTQSYSQINKTFVARLSPEEAFKYRSLDSLNNVKLTFNTMVMLTSLKIADIGADMVLGNDFLVKHKCILNYGVRHLQIGGSNGVCMEFMRDRDVPLKYRCKHLGSSI